MEVEHPRWGLIQGVVAQVDLKAGSEIFTFYGYTENTRKFPFDYPWYWNAKRAIEKEEQKTSQDLLPQNNAIRKNKRK